MRTASNAQTKETAASNVIVNPTADKALGNNPTDPVATTNFDKGAVFNAGEGGSIVQVNRDGSPLGSKQGDAELQSYIQASTGGANSPYSWVKSQAEAADPNASIKMKVDPNWNYMGANSAGMSSGVATDNRTQAQVDKSLNDTTKAIAILPLAIGAAVVAPEAALAGGGANLGAQFIKGEGVSPTEALVSTTMGPIGAIATEAKVVKEIVEAGGGGAIVIKAVIGAATNVTSDSGAKILKGEDITSGDIAAKGLAGAATALLPAKPTLIQPIAGEAINSAADALKNLINSSSTGGSK